MSILKKIILVTIFFSFLCLFLIFFSFGQKLYKLDQRLIATIETTYDLEPLNNYIFYINYQLPNVVTKPSNIKYFFENIKEENDAQTDLDSFYTAVLRRISEFYKWGNELEIKGNLSSINQLLHWWKSNKPNFFEFYKYYHYFSWEASYSRYYFLIDFGINRFLSKDTSYQQKNNLQTLRAVLNSNKKNLEVIIYQLNKPAEEKTYLLKLNSLVFESLLKRVRYYYSDDNNPLQIVYSLENINKDKSFGYYDISLEMKDVPIFPQNNFYLLANQSRYFPLLISQSNLLFFKNVKIDESVKNLIIALPKLSPKKKEEWYTISNKQTNIYKYYLDITSYTRDKPYLLSLNYQNSQPLLFQLEGVTFENKTSQPKLLLNEILIPSSKLQLYNNSFILPNSINWPYLHFVINSGLPLSKMDLGKIQPSLQLIWKPQITIAKKRPLETLFPKINYLQKNRFQYFINVKNTTASQDKILEKSLGNIWVIEKKINLGKMAYVLHISSIYYLFTIYLLIIYFLVIIFIVFNHYRLKIFSLHYQKLAFAKVNLLKIFVRIFDSLGNFAYKFRVYLIILFLALVFLDIFIIPVNYSLLDFFIVFNYSLCILKNRVKFYAITLFCTFLLVGFFLIFKFELFAEKTSSLIVNLSIINVIALITGQKKYD